MAHFARLDKNNVVTMVVVVSNEDLLDDEGKEVEARGIAVCEKVIGPGPWVQTSYNNKFRKRFAGIGFTYDDNMDAFIAPQPYLLWEVDNRGEWQAPYPKPSEQHAWDDLNQMWVLPAEDNNVS